MSSVLYPLGKQGLMSAAFNLSTDTIKAALIDTALYSYNPAHQFFSSITGVQGAPVSLASKAVVLGVFDADDTTFTAVSGLIVSAVVLYKDTTVAGTSPLLAYLDGISVLPNGGDIIVVWDSGPNRIFAL
jgi:hypothetical protein